MTKLIIALGMFTGSITLAGMGTASLWYQVGYRGLITEARWLEADLSEGSIEIAYAYKSFQSAPRRGITKQFGPFGLFRIGSGSTFGRWRYYVLMVPLWMVVAALFIPSSFILKRELQQRRRAKRGECVGCGYNLTGLTEPRCPECGRALAHRCVTCGRDHCRRHGPLQSSALAPQPAWNQ